MARKKKNGAATADAAFDEKMAKEALARASASLEARRAGKAAEREQPEEEEEEDDPNDPDMDADGDEAVPEPEVAEPPRPSQAPAPPRPMPPRPRPVAKPSTVPVTPARTESEQQVEYFREELPPVAPLDPDGNFDLESQRRNDAQERIIQAKDSGQKNVPWDVNSEVAKYDGASEYWRNKVGAERIKVHIKIERPSEEHREVVPLTLVPDFATLDEYIRRRGHYRGYECDIRWTILTHGRMTRATDVIHYGNDPLVREQWYAREQIGGPPPVSTQQVTLLTPTGQVFQRVPTQGAPPAYPNGAYPPSPAGWSQQQQPQQVWAPEAPAQPAPPPPAAQHKPVQDAPAPAPQPVVDDPLVGRPRRPPPLSPPQRPAPMDEDEMSDPAVRYMAEQMALLNERLGRIIPGPEAAPPAPAPAPPPTAPAAAPAAPAAPPAVAPAPAAPVSQPGMPPGYPYPYPYPAPPPPAPQDMRMISDVARDLATVQGQMAGMQRFMQDSWNGMRQQMAEMQRTAREQADRESAAAAAAVTRAEQRPVDMRPPVLDPRYPGYVWVQGPGGPVLVPDPSVAQFAQGFGQQPMGPGFGQQPMGPGFGQQPMGPGFGQQPMGPGFGQQPTGPGFGQQPMGGPVAPTAQQPSPAPATPAPVTAPAPAPAPVAPSPAPAPVVIPPLPQTPPMRAQMAAIVEQFDGMAEMVQGLQGALRRITGNPVASPRAQMRTPTMPEPAPPLAASAPAPAAPAPAPEDDDSAGASANPTAMAMRKPVELFEAGGYRVALDRDGKPMDWLTQLFFNLDNVQGVVGGAVDKYQAALRAGAEAQKLKELEEAITLVARKEQESRRTLERFASAMAGPPPGMMGAPPGMMGAPPGMMGAPPGMGPNVVYEGQIIMTPQGPMMVTAGGLVPVAPPQESVRVQPGPTAPPGAPSATSGGFTVRRVDLPEQPRDDAMPAEVPMPEEEEIPSVVEDPFAGLPGQ